MFQPRKKARSHCIFSSCVKHLSGFVVSRASLSCSAYPPACTALTAPSLPPSSLPSLPCLPACFLLFRSPHYPPCGPWLSITHCCALNATHRAWECLQTLKPNYLQATDDGVCNTAGHKERCWMTLTGHSQVKNDVWNRLGCVWSKDAACVNEWNLKWNLYWSQLLCLSMSHVAENVFTKN